MFVRRKINKSGSISIYVVDKSRGRYDTVKSFGAVATSAEADLLENKARQYIRELTGELEMQFGEMDEAQLEAYAATLDGGRIELAGPELLYGELFDRLGLQSGAGEGDALLFRHMVICRLFNPGSKLRTSGYVNRYLGTVPDAFSIYRCIDSLHLTDYPSHDAEAASCHLFQLLFEAPVKADGEIPAKARGPKPRQPRIGIALLLASDGMPVACRIHLKSQLSKDRRGATLDRFARKYGATGRVPVSEDTGPLREAFRMNRLDLQVRPYRRRAKGRVEGHLCVCLAALAVQTELERLLREDGSGITLEQVREEAARMFRLNYVSPYTGRPKSVLLPMNSLQQKLYGLIHPVSQDQKYL